MTGIRKKRWEGAWPLVSLVVMVLALVIVACGSQQQPSMEEMAQAIDKSLICPVCPGETIDQAQVQQAREMRAVVRERLADGWDRERVLRFFVDRYGEGVLAAPPKKGFSLVAWVVPPTAVAAAAVLLFFVVRAMRMGQTRADPGATAEQQEQELERYLPLVDRELGLPEEGPQGPEKRT